MTRGNPSGPGGPAPDGLKEPVSGGSADRKHEQKSIFAGGAARPSLENAPCSTYPHECVKNRTLDIVLKNAPARLVLEVVAAKLDVHYEGHEPMVVRCGLAADTSTDDPRWSKRLSVEVRDSTASALFGVVAEAMGLRGGVVMQAKDATPSQSPSTSSQLVADR